ncbi:MAG TPA: carboxypeptidase regulatory-like domain-containing protein [Planctomycetes bacterium]|nr:carboxypeptidase regulatory-like domain-containing protein [Planctomycetota bacterium]
MAWACWDQGRKRFASDAILIEPGEKAQLRLHPFPVPFIRLKGIQAWKKIYGKDLHLEWLGTSFFLSDSLQTRFQSPIPQGRDPVLRIPPLPWNTYIPLLVHKKEGVLASIFLGPAFSTAKTSQALYERKYPLKHFPIGTPIEVAGRILDPQGKPVAQARILFFGDQSPTIPCREIRSGLNGRFRTFSPKPSPHVRASKVVILGPGLRPSVRPLSFFFQALKGSSKPKGKTMGVPPDIHMDWGKSYQGHFQGAGGGTLFLHLSINDPKGRSFSSEFLPFPLKPDGSVTIPKTYKRPSAAFLSHPRLGFLQLPLPTSKQLAQGWKLDPGERQKVQILCQREDGRRVSRARIAILRQGRKPLYFSTSSKGPLELSLFPGTYAFFAHRRHVGFAKLRRNLVKATHPTKVLLRLQESITIQGRVVTPKGTPIPQAIVRSTSSPGRQGSWTEGNVLSLLLSKAYSDSQGEFSLELPSDCPSLSLEAQALRRGAAVYNGTSLWTRQMAGRPLRIQITLPEN